MPKDEWRLRKTVHDGYERQGREDKRLSTAANRWLRSHGVQPEDVNKEPARTGKKRKGKRWFLVAQGTKCAMLRADALGWVEYTASKDYWFQRVDVGEQTETGVFYHFKRDGWTMVVRKDLVIRRRRDDTR